MRWQWSTFDALSNTELYALLRLRQEVFVVEQDCPYLDADGLDADAWHLLGWEGSALVVYLRVLPPGQVYPDLTAIGRVVTAPSARARGLGRAVMEEGQRRVEVELGISVIKLSAQAYLRRFYESLGYRVVGPGYDEDGIPHLPMKRGGE